MTEIVGSNQEKQEVPDFAEWSEIVAISLSPDSPRTLHQLYEDIFSKKEASLITENGEQKRYGKVATIDVFYDAGDKRYKLEENRFRLKPGRTLKEFLDGDTEAATASAARPAVNSLSERMKLDGETPEEATLRALREELFDATLTEDVKGQYPQLDNTLQDLIHIDRTSRLERAQDAKGNSYQGLPSVYDEFHSTIIFTPQMPLPISVIDGMPQRLYEFEPERGYVNLFEWKEEPAR